MCKDNKIKWIWFFVPYDPAHKNTCNSEFIFAYTK